MGIYTIKLKTHGRQDISNQFYNLNDCIIHGCKPKIFKIVSGRRKHVDFVAVCEEDTCAKISESAHQTVDAWNKWNPLKIK
jgi:hypothetical protein